jgi:hypothetical protein
MVLLFKILKTNQLLKLPTQTTKIFKKIFFKKKKKKKKKKETETATLTI